MYLLIMIIRVMLYHRIVASLFCAIDDGNANAVLLWFTVIDQWSSYIRYPLFMLVICAIDQQSIQEL